MWIVFSLLALVATIWNWAWTARGKDARWFSFASLAFTALTVCAFYSGSAAWVAMEDWPALMDVVPTTSRWLWICTLGSIAINSVALFRKAE